MCMYRHVEHSGTQQNTILGGAKKASKKRPKRNVRLCVRTSAAPRAELNERLEES